jgi:hypothetical protein
VRGWPAVCRRCPGDRLRCQPQPVWKRFDSDNMRRIANISRPSGWL